MCADFLVWMSERAAGIVANILFALAQFVSLCTRN